MGFSPVICPSGFGNQEVGITIQLVNSDSFISLDEKHQILRWEKLKKLLVAIIASILILSLVYSGSSWVSAASSTPSQVQHVILIMMENKQDSDIVGNSMAPYENLLIRNYAFATNYFALSTSGLYDYLGLMDGTKSITHFSGECLPGQCYYSGANLFSLLQKNGLSWKEYAESMPVACDKNVYGSLPNLYWPWHTAVPYFTDLSSYCSANDLPLGNFSQHQGNFYNALASNSLPSFSMISPNVCDNMHTCPNGENTIAIGDKWLSTLVSMILNSNSFSSTVIFITWDNGPLTTSHVPMIIVGPSNLVNHGTFNTKYTHFSTLATIEDIFHLGNLGKGDAKATVMSAIIPSS